MTKPKNTQAQPPASAATISPFEVDIAQTDVRDMTLGQTRITVESMPDPEAYHTFEVEVRGQGGAIGAYRTVQRIDLATRLRVAADYDALELVGRTFLVEA